MSSSLSRVPKKTALTALRGLLVGTSCTLLLVTEDRRRRLDRARSAKRIVEELDLVKQYHATRFASRKTTDRPTTAVDSPEETPSLAANEHDEWNRYRGTENEGGQGRDTLRNEWRQEEPPSETGVTQRSLLPQQQLPGHWARNRQKSAPASLSRRGNLGKGRRSPSKLPLIHSVDEIVRRMREAVILGDAQSLQDATCTFVNTVQRSVSILTEREKEILLEEAAPLCRKCQEVGIMDQAEQVLLLAIDLGPMWERVFYEFNPVPIVNYATAFAELAINVLRRETGGVVLIPRHARSAAERRLNQSLFLFLPNFKDEELRFPPSNDWLVSAEKLMHLAFDLDLVSRAADVFWRIDHYGGDNAGLVMRHFMARLYEKQDFSRIVNTFSLNRRKLSRASRLTWYTIGNLVTDATDTAVKQKPAKVLRHLLEFRPPDCQIRTTWATKLLYCHWQRGRQFEETVELFREFEKTQGGTLGLETVRHPDGVYRVMIQIAVEAEQWEAVDKFLGHLHQLKPDSIKEARIMGLLALAKAKAGDWGGVWADFQQIEVKDRIADVFIPILKEFVKTHTISEIEAFMKAYIDDLQVPICRYLVNVMANQYGAIRNVDLFVGWLEYCSQAGFQVEAAFSNAILVNCRRNWSFSFPELKVVYRKLKLLSHDFVDHFTENVMIRAAIREHKHRSRIFLRKSIRSLKIRPRSLPFRTMDAEDVRIEMRRVKALCKYKSVFAVYQSALRRGIALDHGHLVLAVNATLKFDGANPRRAFAVIMKAKAMQIDVSLAAASTFLAMLRQIFLADTSDKDELLRQVKGLVDLFENSGFNLSPAALTRAAYLCMKARHFSGANMFAMAALKRKGVSYPWDLPAFNVFLLTYTQMVNIQGLKWTIAGACEEPYFQKKAVLTALKRARTLLSKEIQTTEVQRAIGVLKRAVDRVLLAREIMVKERKELEKETIRVMRQAVLEAEALARDAQDDGSGEGGGGCGQDPELVQRRKEIIREFDEQEEREKTADLRRLAARQAEMQERARASKQFNLEQAAVAERMEKMMRESRLDSGVSF